MKKIFLTLSIILLTICIISCNSSSDTGSQTSGTNRQPADTTPQNPCEGIDNIDICKDSRGIGNIVIETKEAQKMMSNFGTVFKKEGKDTIRAFEPVYWLNKCEILGIAEFLEKEIDPKTKKKYDGVRIFMACDITETPGYGTDAYKQRTSVFIFPTIPRTPPLTSGESNHLTSKIKIPLTGTCYSPFLQDYSAAKPQIKEFNKLYRKEKLLRPGLKKDSLSGSIWIESCVIFTLAKLIKLPNAQIDGININMAAYDKFITTAPGMGRFKDIQSTIILVPTHIVNGERKDYWEIVDCLFNHVKSMGWLPPGGFNHGELCPNKCD